MLLRIEHFILVLFGLTCAEEVNEEEFEKDDGVFILTEKNFSFFLQQHPTALVKFYAPWCGHCKAMAPEFAKAAAKLKVPLAKVDATVETELAKTYDIKGYPTLKFWHDDEDPIDYDGGRDADAIVQWVSEKTDPDYKPPPSAVAQLTNQTFVDFIASNSLTLVKFYAPWCGHCKKLAPEYEKAAKKLMDKGILLAEVDATVEKNLATEYDVTGYPKLYIFRYGKKFDYQGPRDAEGIVKYMINQAEPALKRLITVKDAQRFMRKDDVTIIGFFNDGNAKLLDSLNDAAEMTRDDFHMAFSVEPDVAKYFSVDSDRIVIFFPEMCWSKYEPKRISYDSGDTSPQGLVSYFREKSVPLVGHRTKKNVATRYNQFPLVVVYYNVDFSLEYREGTQYWRNKVVEIANKFKGEKYRFAVANEDEFADELAAVGLDDSGLEHNVIAFGYDGKKYPMRPDDFDDELSENLSAFMKKLSSGKIKPFVKSAPVVKDDKGPVKTVVLSNFAQIVYDETKDVLVEFYAPWCGHCKAFEPKYKQLAAKLKNEEPNLLLVKFDATANDTPKHYDVNGFPTIYFAPSGKKEEPIKYDGNRDPDDIISFMKKYASVSFQGKTEL